MGRLVFAAIVLLAVAAAQSTVQIKAGALTCAAIRRTPPANGNLNVQTFCYAGSPVVTNHSDLIAPGGSTLALHVYGPDLVIWQFWDAGSGVIRYQVFANGNPGKTQTGTLP